MRAITRWGHGLTVGFGLQVLGLAIDGAWHATHPEGEMAPFWAHLPIHAGILVLVGVVVVVLRDRRVVLAAAWVVAGVGLQALGDAWSLAVRAEANNFFVPAAMIAVGGAMAFAGAFGPVALARVRRVRQRRTRATIAA